MKLVINRPGVSATIDSLPSRRALRLALADNIRSDRGTAHITITVWSRKGEILYQGTVEGLKGKRL